MKRFYTHVRTSATATGIHIQLDDKPILTPGRTALTVPLQPLADAIAAEWSAQADTIKPETMPLTRHANSVLDRIIPRRVEVVAEIAAFATTDSLCYRAAFPDDLVALQTQHWDPLIAWAKEAYGATLCVTTGVKPLQQTNATIAEFTQAVDACNPWILSGLHTAVHICGSLVVGLALSQRHITVDAAWAAGQLEENYQISRWGEDSLAIAASAAKRRDLDAAAQWLYLCINTKKDE